MSGKTNPATAREEVDRSRSLRSSPLVIITDIPMRAEREYPSARILYRLLDVLDLPDGAEIAIVEYSRPPLFMGHQGVVAARSLAARGIFKLVEPKGMENERTGT